MARATPRARGVRATAAVRRERAGGRQRRPRSGAALGAPSGVVAIVGRPNVGKSTLFNRLTGQRKAIVDEMAGLTRDRLYGVAEWGGRVFTLVDTAGLDPGLQASAADEAALIRGTQEQARLAIAEADVCALLVDVRHGVTGLDEDVARILRSGGKPVLLVGNKADSAVDPYWSHEVYRLGLGEPVFISALAGKDTGDLLDRLIELLPPASETAEPPAPEHTLRASIIGRPNVGKSSLLNALVGEERALVSPVAGTTRDTVDTWLEDAEGPVQLVDTAGIRRRGVVSTDVEHYSLLRALKAMERSEVAILVVDVNDGIVAQDRHIAGYAADAGKALVVVANKWDLLDQETRADPETLKKIAAAFQFVPGVPVLAVSAKDGRNLRRILPAARMVSQQRATHIPTPALNTLLRSAVDEHPPPYHKNRRLKLFYATQAATPSPTIVLFVNDPDLINFAYIRYLENRIRAVFPFNGSPLRLLPRRREGDKER
ncbi:MAG TPA: ribosome biogenesis GTPase Der [Candidatus Angelobacter sp.]|jgi:GTP-binding protein|nr:ribosome biogenesis GTPase Der [Candidatus Angelobacter sp.]